jgi:hypothetical protein
MATRHTIAFVVCTLLAPVAFAQQSSGNLAGDGKAGDTVRVERTETGFVRELKVEQDGKYRMPRIPIGIYVVTVTHADGTKSKPQEVRVQTGTTARVK